MRDRTFFSILLGTRQSIALALSLMLVFASSALANDPALMVSTPARLVIPTINLDSPIVPVKMHTIVVNGKNYGKWAVAKKEVGWHNLTARLGQMGNTVLAGHSDIEGRIFRNLKYVNIGDEIIAHAGANGQMYRYVITDKILVQEVGVSLETRIKNGQWILPTQDERLTLITCARPGATHRLIVVARPVHVAH